MKSKTKMALTMAYDYCRKNNKSFGFMLQYMQDKAGVDFDTAYGFYFKKIHGLK